MRLPVPTKILVLIIIFQNLTFQVAKAQFSTCTGFLNPVRPPDSSFRRQPLPKREEKYGYRRQQYRTTKRVGIITLNLRLSLSSVCRMNNPPGFSEIVFVICCISDIKGDTLPEVKNCPEGFLTEPKPFYKRHAKIYPRRLPYQDNYMFIQGTYEKIFLNNSSCSNGMVLSGDYNAPHNKKRVVSGTIVGVHVDLPRIGEKMNPSGKISIFTKDPVKIEGSYKDTDPDSALVDNWICMTGDTNCTKLLPSKIQTNNGSILDIAGYTFQYGTNYTITYNITDQMRIYLKQLLIMTKIQPIETEINITKYEYFVKEEITIHGFYKDPDILEVVNPFVIQQWQCVANNIENCKSLIKDEFISREGAESKLVLPPYTLESPKTYTFIYVAMDERELTDMEGNLKEGRTNIIFQTVISPLEVVVISNETGSIKVSQEIQLIGSFEDPDVVNKLNPDVQQSWFCFKDEVENCTNLLTKITKTENSSTLIISPYSLESGANYKIFYKAQDVRDILSQQGLIRQTNQSLSFKTTVQNLEVKINPDQNQIINASEKIKIEGSYEDPDIKDRFSQTVAQIWYCIKNEKEDCESLLSNIQMQRKSQIITLEPYTFQSGHNYSILYEAKDYAKQLENNQIRQSRVSVLISILVQPLSVNISPDTSQQIYSNESAVLKGEFLDPDVKNKYSKNIIQTWICLKNNKEICSDILYDFQKEDNTLVLNLHPYDLAYGNTYTFTYKVQDIRNLMHHMGGPRESEKSVTYTILSRPIDVFIKAFPAETASTNQQIQINGTYIDHDVEQKYGSHIVEQWSCVKNEEYSCSSLLKDITSISGGQILIIPPYSLEAGSTYKFAYEIEDSNFFNDPLERKRNNIQSLSIRIIVQPLNASIFSNSNQEVEVSQQIIITANYEDPDLKEKFGPNIITSWSCVMNEGQSCSSILTDKNLRNNQEQVTIQPYSLQSGNKYTFFYKASDTKNLKDNDGNARQVIRNVTFISKILALKVNITSNLTYQDVKSDEAIQIKGSYEDPDIQTKLNDKLAFFWSCLRNDKDNCSSVLKDVEHTNNESVLVIHPYSLENGNQYTFFFKVKDQIKTTDSTGKPRESEISMSFSVKISPLTATLSSTHNGTVDANEEITIFGMYRDPDIKVGFGEQILQKWNCLQNGEKDCNNLLFARDHKNGSSEVILPPFTLQSGNKFNITYKARDSRNLMDYTGKPREAEAFVTFEVRVQSLTVNIASPQNMTISRRQKVEIDGTYNEPNEKMTFCPHILQSWTCLRNGKESCSNLLQNITIKNNGQSLTISPFTLLSDNKYTFSYKAKDHRNIVDYKGNLNQDEKSLTFEVMVFPIEVTLSSNRQNTVSANEDVTITGSYVDPDQENDYGPQIAVKWSCNKNIIENCNYLFLKITAEKNEQTIVIPPYTLETGSSYTFSFEAWDSRNIKDHTGTFKWDKEQLTLEVLAQPIQATMTPNQNLLINSSHQIEISGQYTDPDAKENLNSHLIERWECIKNKKETCQFLITNVAKLSDKQILNLPSYSLKSGNVYTISYHVEDSRNLKDTTGNLRKTKKEITISVLIQPLTVNLVPETNQTINISDKIEMQGSYLDPNVEGYFGSHVVETWSCVKNYKDNCMFLLQNVKKLNGSQTLVIAPYKLESGNKYTITYKAKDEQNPMDFEGNIREGIESRTYTVLVRPFQITINSSIQFDDIYSNQKLQMNGFYEDPDAENKFGLHVKQTWYCYKDGENCQESISNIIYKNGGSTIELLPFSLESGYNYLFEYNVKDIRNIKISQSRNKEESKNITFSVQVSPLVVSLTPPENQTVNASQEIEITGSYEDPDFKEKFGDHINESWKCLKGDKQNCQELLQNTIKKNGSQTVVLPPFALEIGYYYTFYYTVKDTRKQNLVANVRKEITKQLTLYVDLQQIEVRIASKSNKLLQTSKPVIIDGWFSDPTEEKQYGSHLEYTWECFKNNIENCSEYMQNVVALNDTHSRVTIKQNTLKVGQNYTFTFRVWDNRKHISNVEVRENFKSLTFVILKDILGILKDITILKETCFQRQSQKYWFNLNCLSEKMPQNLSVKPLIGNLNHIINDSCPNCPKFQLYQREDSCRDYGRPSWCHKSQPFSRLCPIWQSCLGKSKLQQCVPKRTGPSCQFNSIKRFKRGKVLYILKEKSSDKQLYDYRVSNGMIVRMVIFLQFRDQMKYFNFGKMFKNLELDINIENNNDSDYGVVYDPLRTVKSYIIYSFSFQINTTFQYLPVKYSLRMVTEEQGNHSLASTFYHPIRVLRDFVPLIKYGKEVNYNPPDTIILDGTESYDPEQTTLNYSTVKFTWSCTTDYLNAEAFCNSKIILRNDSRAKISGIGGTIMKINKRFKPGSILFFNLTMWDASKKPFRRPSSFIQKVTILDDQSRTDTPIIRFQCNKYCVEKYLTPADRWVIYIICANCKDITTVYFKWYFWDPVNNTSLKFNWRERTEEGKYEGLGLYRVAVRPDTFPQGTEFELYVEARFTVI